MIAAFQEELENRKSEGLHRELKNLENAAGRFARFNGKSYLNFVSNNYLALNGHPAIQKASLDWMQKYGTGSGGSRLLGGSLSAQSEFESELAAFKHKDRALIFNSGYAANLAMASVFADAQTHIFCDRLNHASIYDGLKLSAGKMQRFKHNDMNHLESLMQKNGPKRIVIVESLFSMDGDFAPLEEIAFLCKKYNALFFVDEAHAEPIYGPEGRGLLFESQVAPAADLILGAFGKGYGTFGAYLAGNEILIETLINKARSFIYTTALPPGVIGAMQGAFYIARQADERREKLYHLGRYLNQNLKIRGWDTLKSHSHIVPLIIGENSKCLKLQQTLFEHGIWTQAIREPTVPKGTARLRLNVNAEHEFEDIDLLISHLEDLK